MIPLKRLSLGALLLPLLAVWMCSSALAPLQSQWGAVQGPQNHGSCTFVAPSTPLQSAALGATSHFLRHKGYISKGIAQSTPAGFLLRPACHEWELRGMQRQSGSPARRVSQVVRLRMTDTRSEVKSAVEQDGASEGSRRRTTATLKRTGPFEDAKNAICSAVKSAGAAVGLPVEEWDKNGDSTSPEVDQFVAEVDKEVSKWVKQVQEMEDANVDDIRESLDAVYEQLSLGSSLQWSRQASSADRVVAWRRIRKLTDPSTKRLLISIEKIRRRYEKGVYTMTDKVRPWTQEEILDGLGTVTDSITGKKNSLSSISDDLEQTTESITDVIKPFSNEEVAKFTSEMDGRWSNGVQAAEEELRAGVERARYNIWRRTKMRTVEAGAASLAWRDGCLHATSFDGKLSVRILEDMGPNIYIDDIDDVHLFLGMQQAQNLAQHQVRLGSFPATTERWLSCARQKLWWMSPDVGSRLDPIPAESQFLLYDAGEGMYAVILPLVGSSFRSSLWGEAKGGIDLHIESGDPNVKCQTCATSVLVAAGSDPYKLLARAFAAAADRLGSFRVREEKSLPEPLEVFGWCTWDAFYSQVEPQGIKQGLAELAKGGTPSRLLILDDGWQSTENLLEYRAQEDDDVRGEVSAADLAGGGVIEAEDFANSQLTSLKDIPVRVLTWWYLNVVEKSEYDSVPVRVWRWLTYNVIRNDLMKYFAEATDWSKRLTELTPNGKFRQLGALVRELKSDYGLEYTYCWHALTGYWLGVDPSAPGMQKFNPVIQYASTNFGYTPGILLVEPTMAWNPSSFEGVGIIPPSTIAEFFGELHSSLKDAGVDGVKCDAQAAVTQFGVGFGGGPRLTRTYVHAMEQSAKEFLDGNCINCMCHPTENIYSYKDTAVARASDDFYPREPASHTVHVVNVAYNSLFLGEIVHPDWDMFQSQHVAATLHAAARAVGGCAVYTSDRPKVHDFDLLRKLVLPDGSVLRARLPGRPTRDCLFTDVARDGTSALKIWNRNWVGGVLGVFNLQGAWWDRNVRNFGAIDDELVPTVCARVKASDVEGLDSEVGRYALWSHREQTLRLVGAEEETVIELQPRASDVLTVSALQRLPEVVDSQGRAAVWAPIGLTSMLNGGGAIMSVRTLRGGARQLKKLLQISARLQTSKDAGGRPSVTTDVLEEVRAWLSLLADVEESSVVEGELRGLDLGALLKSIDGILGQAMLPTGARSTLKEIKSSTTTLQRRVASMKSDDGADGADGPRGTATSRRQRRWSSGIPSWRSPRLRARQQAWDAEAGADAEEAKRLAPKVRAVVTVKGQGDFLCYASAKPVSIKARKIVRRLSVEASAAQAVVDVVSGGRGRRAEDPKGGAGGVERGAQEDRSTAEVEGAAVIGLGQSPWVEIGDSTEWPFEYAEETGELVVCLPQMREDVKDSGRWALTFSWPLTEVERL